jgi:hypothetical protein
MWDQGGCDEDGAHPPAGTPSGQREPTANARSGVRITKTMPTLGHEGTRDHEGHVRLTWPPSSCWNR